MLRDVSSPNFQSANTAAKLAQSFTGLLNDHVDLAAVAIASPQIEEATIIPGNNMLRIKGRFAPPAPAIEFILIFETTGGLWRLFGISVQPVKAAAIPPSPTVAKAPAQAPSGGKKK